MFINNILLQYTLSTAGFAQSFDRLYKLARRIIDDGGSKQVREGVWLDWTGGDNAGPFGATVLCHAISPAPRLLHSSIDFHILGEMQATLQPRSSPEMR